jgi:nicotinate-nucleotide adenylyltransferase
VIALFGGAFDPPHEGHVALLEAAKEELAFDRSVVIVAAAPGHKEVETPAAVRLELARAAFPGEEVVLDEHERTIDTLRAHPEWADPVLLIGADEFCDFPAWKEPDAVLERARVAVAARPGYARARLEAVLERLQRPERVLFFDLHRPEASRKVRAGDELEPAVSPTVAAIIRREGLYGRGAGYTEHA